MHNPYLQKFLSSLLIVLLAVLVVSPTTAMAQNKAKNKQSSQIQNTNKNKNGGGGNFCSRLDGVSERNLARIAATKTKIQERQAKRTQQTTEKMQKRARMLKEGRAKRDSRLNTRFQKLQTKATTDTQKAAVSTFIASVQSNLATKRSAMDAARNEFYTGIMNAMNARFPALLTAITSYENAAKKAYDTAKAGCTANVSPNTVRATYQESMRLARTTYRKSASDAMSLKTEMQALTQKKKQAFTAARNAFKLKMQAAHLTLKNALGQNNTATTTPPTVTTTVTVPATLTPAPTTTTTTAPVTTTP